MTNKDFRTIDEQVELLRSRGLTIEDEAEAKEFLLRNNYYRVSGYSLTLRKNDILRRLLHSGTLRIFIISIMSFAILFCAILKSLKCR